MWSSTYSQTIDGAAVLAGRPAIDAQRIWDIYSDVDRWPTWQPDVEYAHLEGTFEAGAVIRLKPKGGPRVRIELTEVQAPTRFVDITRFPLARMIDVHELLEAGDGLEIRNQISMIGPLAWVWRKLVGEGVAKGLPEQTARLVEQARSA